MLHGSTRSKEPIVLWYFGYTVHVFGCNVLLRVHLSTFTFTSFVTKVLLKMMSRKSEKFRKKSESKTYKLLDQVIVTQETCRTAVYFTVTSID